MDNDKIRSLGISFSDGHIRFTELTRELDTVVLDNADSFEVDFDFDDDLSKFKSNQRALTNISGEIQKYINQRNTQYTSVSAAIGTSQAFLITLPIEYSEGRQAVNSKISWELSNYFPDNYSDYIVNTYRLNLRIPSGGIDDFLVIAVNKNSLEFIKRIFRLCNLELSVIDIDHFSAEHNLRRNYPDLLPGKSILLIGLKQGRIDYGFITDKKYRYYTYSKYSSKSEYHLNLTRKLNSMVKVKSPGTVIDTALIYGDDISDETIQVIKKAVKVKVQPINAFENINSSTEILRNEDLRKFPYRYAQSCGVALRALKS